MARAVISSYQFTMPYWLSSIIQSNLTIRENWALINSWHHFVSRWIKETLARQAQLSNQRRKSRREFNPKNLCILSNYRLLGCPETQQIEKQSLLVFKFRFWNFLSSCVLFCREKLSSNIPRNAKLSFRTAKGTGGAIIQIEQMRKKTGAECNPFTLLELPTPMGLRRSISLKMSSSLSAVFALKGTFKSRKVMRP